MGDQETFAKIVASEYDPATVKALGRQVRPFDQATWEAVRSDVVARGNYLKFSQNARLRKLLLSTAGLTLVEASRYDSIWGIGLNLSDAAAGAKWRGLNLLGAALMRVREAIEAGTQIEAPQLTREAAGVHTAAETEAEPEALSCKKQRSSDRPEEDVN